MLFLELFILLICSLQTEESTGIVSGIFFDVVSVVIATAFLFRLRPRLLDNVSPFFGGLKHNPGLGPGISNSK